MDNQSLTITEKKLVYCVYELSLRGYAPSDSCLVQILKGNSCNGRPTSCADQLTIALTDALQQPKAATVN